MTDPLLLLTLLLLTAIGVASAVLAVRFRLPFRIAARNIRRARVRSVLVVLGLLVGTAIVSGSLVVGDTVYSVNVHYSYIADGYTDEAIYGFSGMGVYQYFPAAIAQQVVNTSASNPHIAGVTPEIVDTVQVFDRSTGIPQTNLYLVGADPPQARALGPFTTTSGATIAGPDPGEVFIDQLAASDLNASVGDHVVLYGAGPVPSTVQAIVHDDTRGGAFTAGLRGGSVFVDLGTAQAIENRSGLVNYIAVTNVGSLPGGVALSSAVSAELNASLAGIPGASQLASHTVLQDDLANAAAQGNGLVTIFLVFGLFSIIAGAMLIVGIFAMIAEERKGEMGMLRAIGLPRRDVVLSYYFEGLIYAAGSALAGTFLGVVTGFALLWAYVQLVGSSDVGVAAVITSFTYSSSTLLTSYLIGFLLTLGTVVVASVRVSRLNIVRAIRDVPEPPPPIRTYTYLAYVGAVSLVVGALVFATTFRGTGDVSYPMIGGGLAILGAGLVASRFARNRPVFTAVGAGLLVWAGWEGLQNAVLGSAHSGGIFVVFVQGIMLIGGAVLVFGFNGPQLADALDRAVSGRVVSAPVARMGLAYPSRRAMRTSINTTIFALVLFVLVVLATYSATETGNLQDSITAQSGGYTFYAYSAQPVPNLPAAIAANASLQPLYSHVVPIVIGFGDVTVASFGPAAYHDQVYAAPLGQPAASSFYETNDFPFSATLGGISASAAMTELATNRSAAIVDGSYGSGGFSTASHPIVSPGDVIRVRDPGNGLSANVTVVGILKELPLSGVWLNPATASGLGFNTTRGYLLTVHPGVSSTLAAQRTKAAFYPYGLVLVDFSAILASTIAIISGEIGLLEVFIGLGLAVGIAALGIVAHRAVTERRREIGMLRATGLTRGMVLKIFLVEYSFVTLFGAAIGGLIGLLLVYNLVISPGSAAAGVTRLYVPWANLVLVLLVTGLLATLAVIGPSRKAARLPPAEAVRGLE